MIFIWKWSASKPSRLNRWKTGENVVSRLEAKQADTNQQFSPCHRSVERTKKKKKKIPFTLTAKILKYHRINLAEKKKGIMREKLYGILKKAKQITQRGFKSWWQLEKRVLRVFKQLKIRLPDESHITISNKTLIQKDTCTTEITEVLFTTAKHGSDLSDHQQMNDEDDVVQWSISQKKKWNNATCSDMDELIGCHTEWSSQK